MSKIITTTDLFTLTGSRPAMLSATLTRAGVEQYGHDSERDAVIAAISDEIEDYLRQWQAANPDEDGDVVEVVAYCDVYEESFVLRQIECRLDERGNFGQAA